MGLEPLYIPEKRRQWAKVDATTLTHAAPRLDLTPQSVKSRRDRHPERFPDPLPVNAAYLSGNSIYSFRELLLMVEADWNIQEAAGAAELRAEIEGLIKFVEPVSLAIIAERTGQELTIVRSTWRGGRTANRGSKGNGFPEALALGASHTMSTMLYCWGEIEAWINWSLSDGYAAQAMGATNEPPLAEFLEGLTNGTDQDRS